MATTSFYLRTLGVHKLREALDARWGQQHAIAGVPVTATERVFELGRLADELGALSLVLRDQPDEGEAVGQVRRIVERLTVLFAAA